MNASGIWYAGQERRNWRRPCLREFRSESWLLTGRLLLIDSYDRKYIENNDCFGDHLVFSFSGADITELIGLIRQ